MFLKPLLPQERYEQFTFWWSDRTIWGKLANWKSTKKMSWLERCCHRSWLVPPSSNFSSVSDRSMAYTTRSTSWSSSTGQRCLCCKAEIRYSIPKALPLTSELVQLQFSTVFWQKAGKHEMKSELKLRISQCIKAALCYRSWWFLHFITRYIIPYSVPKQRSSIHKLTSGVFLCVL